MLTAIGRNIRQGRNSHLQLVARARIETLQGAPLCAGALEIPFRRLVSPTPHERAPLADRRVRVPSQTPS